jgi:hypothetical protein
MGICNFYSLPPDSSKSICRKLVNSSESSLETDAAANLNTAYQRSMELVLLSILIVLEEDLNLIVHLVSNIIAADASCPKRISTSRSSMLK